MQMILYSNKYYYIEVLIDLKSSIDIIVLI
jgi:hypothetical protein